MNYSKKQIERLLEGIAAGVVTVRSLPKDLYFAIAEYLKKALYKGFGAKLSDVKRGTRDYELLSELRENIYMFSAAKTYQQVRSLSDLLTDGDAVRPFSEFRDLAMQEYELYNKTWLQTEYDTAIGQAQSASLWNNIQSQKDVLPLLRYSAVMDPNTSEICAPLDGITLPVDDSFWDVFMPLNHFNCRCTVMQLDEGAITSPEEVSSATDEVRKEMQPVFEMNPGRDRYIYDKNHPYFEVAPKDKGFARENFGLPIPESD